MQNRNPELSSALFQNLLSFSVFGSLSSSRATIASKSVLKLKQSQWRKLLVICSHLRSLCMIHAWLRWQFSLFKCQQPKNLLCRWGFKKVLTFYDSDIWVFVFNWTFPVISPPLSLLAFSVPFTDPLEICNEIRELSQSNQHTRNLNVLDAVRIPRRMSQSVPSFCLGGGGCFKGSTQLPTFPLPLHWNRSLRLLHTHAQPRGVGVGGWHSNRIDEVGFDSWENT